MNNTRWGYKVRFLVIFAISGLVFAGCGSGNGPDVDNIKVKIESRRLDLDLYKLDTNHLGKGLTQLHEKYPRFLNFYLDTLMGFGINGNYTDTNPGIEKGLLTFLSHKDYRGVFDTVAKHYPDTKDVEERLAKGFQYMKYYFPSYEVPRIIYLVSGLNNYGALTYDSDILGIGLDMFLGPEYPFYKAVQIPEYFYRQLTPEYIPVAVFRSLYRQDRPFFKENSVLLEMMIQSGKEMYFTSKILPFVPENARFAFSKEQLEWCKENEGMVYDFFVREKLLYENSLQKVLRYVVDGPSATGMPTESPGNVGSWIGYQIVRAWMDQHPDVSLQELLDMNKEPQKFLQESKYKPK